MQVTGAELTIPKPLDIEFFKSNSPCGRSDSFINMREVNKRFSFPLGTYCIVPSTFAKDEEGEFLLRVLTENINNMQ